MYHTLVQEVSGRDEGGEEGEIGSRREEGKVGSRREEEGKIGSRREEGAWSSVYLITAGIPP